MAWGSHHDPAMAEFSWALWFLFVPSFSCRVGEGKRMIPHDGRKPSTAPQTPVEDIPSAGSEVYEKE